MSHAPVLWAQRSSEDEESKNVLLLTIEAPELDKDYTLEFPDDGARLVFKGKSQSYPSAGHTEKAKEYNLDIELFDQVLGDKVKRSLTGKSLVLSIPKKELKQEYWPRLTKDKKKAPYIKTDFSKWVDEDEQDAAEEVDAGMDPSSMGMGGAGGMPGMGGMGGMGGGAGGMGGMDMEAMMRQMGGGGMGGMGGGAGGMDMEALMKQMGAGGAGGAGGMPDFGGDDDDEDDMPALEETDGTSASDAKGKGKAADDDMPPLEDA